MYFFIYLGCMQISRFWMGNFLWRGKKENLLWNMRLCGTVNTARIIIRSNCWFVVHWGFSLWTYDRKSPILSHEHEVNQKENYQRKYFIKLVECDISLRFQLKSKDIHRRVDSEGPWAKNVYRISLDSSLLKKRRASAMK